MIDLVASLAILLSNFSENQTVLTHTTDSSELILASTEKSDPGWTGDWDELNTKEFIFRYSDFSSELIQIAESKIILPDNTGKAYFPYEGENGQPLFMTGVDMAFIMPHPPETPLPSGFYVIRTQSISTGSGIDVNRDKVTLSIYRHKTDGADIDMSWHSFENRISFNSLSNDFEEQTYLIPIPYGIPTNSLKDRQDAISFFVLLLQYLIFRYEEQPFVYKIERIEDATWKLTVSGDTIDDGDDITPWNFR